MKAFLANLKEEYNVKGGTLNACLMDSPFDVDRKWRRPAVIIVPGGGYGYVSKREGEPVAAEFFAKGFQTFVLTYEVGGENGYPYPEQFLELASAVDYVKKHAEEFYVNKDEVFVVGFSAGGHLTGNLAVDYENVPQIAGRDLDCKPTAVGLCYPVISKINGHQGSYENLLYGYTDEAKEELLKKLNLDEAVTEKTVPSFLWTTAEDICVPPDNAIRYALACNKKKVQFELHVYPHGGHGKSIASREINDDETLDQICKWLPACIDFFREFITERH